MSTLSYNQTLGGKGVAQGLPLRRGSQLYDTAYDSPYPNAFSTGLDSDMHAYDRGTYLRVPHLPVTFIIEPYINNHKAGGTFTRRQYYVIKRGQPVMASQKRESTIALFDESDASVDTRTYNDPEKWGTNGILRGYSDGENWYRLTDSADPLPANDGKVIDADAYTALPAGPTADTDDKSDYELIDPSTDVLTQAEFDAIKGDLTEAEMAKFTAVYDEDSLVDTNDKIATGGVNQYAVVESAVFGTSDQVKYTEIHADVFYFGAATRTEGFIMPSTGGAPRTAYFNEVDREAGVTLPKEETNKLRLVTPLGNTTDVTVSNKANWVKSAVVFPVRPTIGFAHTDLEQTLSHQFHHFQTGTDVHQPVRKARHQVPFVDITKTKEILAEYVPNTTFNITDEREGRSGIKVGVYTNVDGDGSTDVEIQNLYSLLQAEDSGYANLYYNFAAPFLMATRAPRIHDKIVPDLFGNFTLFGEVAVDNDTNAFQTLSTANGSGVTVSVAAEKAAAATIQGEHVCGKVLNIYDVPRRGIGTLHLEINPIFQSRIIDRDRNYLNEGGRRVKGADNAGMEAILSDFIFMLLGGANYDWSSGMLQDYGGSAVDISKVAEDLVLKGAVGLVEIASDALM